MEILVEVPVGEETADALVATLAECVARLRVGPSLAADVDYGPLVTRNAVECVEGYIRRGGDEGATFLADGRGLTVPVHEEGFYLGPTLFDHVTTDMAIYREEIFGPCS